MHFCCGQRPSQLGHWDLTSVYSVSDSFDTSPHRNVFFQHYFQPLEGMCGIPANIEFYNERLEQAAVQVPWWLTNCCSVQYQEMSRRETPEA